MNFSETVSQKRPKRLPEVVADRLQEHILVNKLQPGDRLPTETELTAMYDVSRQVIRETARLLEQRGVVEIRAGRGMRVNEVTVDGVNDIYRLFLRFKPENFNDLLTTRLILEPGVAAIAAEKRTDADIAAIRETLDESRALDGEAFTQHLSLDLEFHRRVTVACHNPFLFALCSPINESLREIYAEPISYLSSLPQTHTEHGVILDAIIARDAEAAHAATVQHLQRVGQEANKLIPE